MCQSDAYQSSIVVLAPTMTRVTMLLQIIAGDGDADGW